MKKNLIVFLTSAAIILIAAVAYAASSASCSLSYLTYRGTGTLVRNTSNGNVTGITTKQSGDGVYLMMRVTDRTVGVKEYPLTLSRSSSISFSYTPAYAVEDTIGATSLHGIYSAISGSSIVTKTISIP